MMPITDFLSCTHVFDEFESLSPAQRQHAETYATGLVAASNKTVAGIAREVLPAQGKRAGRRMATPSPMIGSLKKLETSHRCRPLLQSR